MSDKVDAPFEVIADQDGDPVSIARKLENFAADLRRPGLGPIKNVCAADVENAEEDHRWEVLDDLIETLNRQVPEDMTVGWHPDDSGTIIYAQSAWFDFESPYGSYGT
jgi:hypothetical protein